MTQQILNPVQSDRPTNLTLLEKLRDFCSSDYNPNIGHPFDYWENRKNEKELYLLSQVIISVPATQVSVERAFSALNLVMTKQRTRLGKEILNEILLIKLNRDVFNRLDISYNVE
jgi:hypothetical protein